MTSNQKGWLGHRLDNGAVVVALTWVRVAQGDENDREGIALCIWGTSMLPYVTWAVGLNPRDPSTLDAFRGSYFGSLAEAVADYTERGGR